MQVLSTAAAMPPIHVKESADASLSENQSSQGEDVDPLSNCMHLYRDGTDSGKAERVSNFIIYREGCSKESKERNGVDHVSKHEYAVAVDI